MITFKVIQRPHHKRIDGTIHVVIRVTDNGKITHKKTGVFVKPAQFREGAENWVIKHPDCVILNAQITRVRSEVMHGVYEGPKKELSFYTLINKKLEQHEARNQAGAYDKLITISRALKKSWAKDVNPSGITKALVDKFVSDRIADGINPNTIKKALKVLGSVLGGEGKNPFAICQAEIKAVPSARDFLTKSEVAAIEAAALQPTEDLARDLFLFSYYAHGMRIGNVVTMREDMITGGHIVYRMSKGRKVKSIEITPKLQAIIDKYKGKSLYLFPCLKKVPKDIWEERRAVGPVNATINRSLKVISAIAGINRRLHCHMARHSISNLMNSSGVSIGIIKDTLGHSSVKTTEMYLKSFTDDAVNDAVRDLYGG